MPKNGTARSAVILYGLLHRSLAFTGRSIERCLLAPLRAAGGVDVFYHSWDTTQVNNFRTGEAGNLLDPGEIGVWLPEAQGLIESEQAFDQSQDWEPLFANNIMRKCCPDEASARLTLMNQMRTLESLQRAWDFFLQHKRQNYRQVVATRADLLFLTPLPRLDPRQTDQNLYLPAFQDWGGLNDRFALGSEAQMAIYSRRKAFWEQCMQTSDEGNAEKLLKRWLVEENRLSPRLLDFVFLRTRADGHASPHDIDSACELIARRHQTRATTSVSTAPTDLVPSSEHFIVLSQQAGPAALRLERLFGQLGPTTVLVNRPDAQALGVWYPDEYLAAYGLATSGPATALTARALLDLELAYSPQQAVWLIGEAVAGNATAFGQLLRVTRELQPDLAAYGLRSLGQTVFPPLCRLSPRLIAALLARCPRQPARPAAQLLPAVLAEHPEFRLLDWQQPGLDPCFGSFRAEPDVDRITPGISHPVTNLYSHIRICSL